MNVPDNLLYTKTHEWIRLDGDVATVGVTDFAQDQLSDVTFVELPAVGDQVSAEEEVAVVESVKAASDVYAPMTGTISEVNHSLETSPEILNRNPYGEGWLFKIKISDSSELEGFIDAAAYSESIPDGD